jgi:hypothetical protein
MPRTTLSGDDDDHDLSPAEKDEREKALRKQARELLRAGRAKERRELENRATNISRKPSKKADHH